MHQDSQQGAHQRQLFITGTDLPVAHIPFGHPATACCATSSHPLTA